MKGQVMCVNPKTEMLPHNSRVEVYLRNLTARAVKVPVKTTLGEVSACNVVPPIWGQSQKQSLKTKTNLGLKRCKICLNN